MQHTLPLFQGNGTQIVQGVLVQTKVMTSGEGEISCLNEKVLICQLLETHTQFLFHIQNLPLVTYLNH